MAHPRIFLFSSDIMTIFSDRNNQPTRIKDAVINRILLFFCNLSGILGGNLWGILWGGPQVEPVERYCNHNSVVHEYKRLLPISLYHVNKIEKIRINKYYIINSFQYLVWKYYANNTM